MDFDLQWFLLSLPLAFGLGWMASRLDLRQLRRETSEAPRAYFKGLNLLLNEQQDMAIDAFIEAVQNDPDTTELHFALGNLFRRRGEFERAVRVHQHLLGRGDLKSADRERAQRALAQDYMKAGLFDRADEAWRALEGTTFAGEARLALLTLHERSRDWAKAIEVARQLEHSGEASFAVRIAHYECEMALEAEVQGRTEDASAALARAHATAPDAARPLVLQGQRHFKRGEALQAFESWDQLRLAHPLALLLVAEDYARAALACQCSDTASRNLAELFAALPAIELLRAMRLLDGTDAEPDSPAQQQRLLAHLKQHPSLSAAQMLLALDPARWGDEGLVALRQALDKAANPLQRYRCAACGFEARHYFWQCPGCLTWDSYPTQHVEAL